MREYTFNFGRPLKWLPPKLLLIMKLTTFILMIALAQVSAATFGQKLTYSKNGASLAEIFTAIESQTGYSVFYPEDKTDFSKKYNVNFKNTALKDVLESVLDKKSLEYRIENRNILIKEKEPTFLESLASRWAAIDVHGRVVDSLGYGLAGASVTVKGSSLTTSTSAIGTFQLKGVDEGATLVITYIGYITREVAVNKEFNLIILKQSSSKLDEVQVIAYGTTTQRLSTGNVSTVKAADIEKAPVANPLLAIAGRVPGVFIQQSSGVPGSGVKVLIQGQNSIGYGNDPFYVIDGVPYTSQLLPGLTNELGQSGAGTPANGYTNTTPTNGNPLNFINPQDIESIDILKDADATSIYGSRAANGAIIITTKKGKAGKTDVNLNVQQGWGKITRRLPLMNTQQYLEMRKEAYSNDNKPVPTVLTPGAYDLTFWDQNKYTDWQEVLIGGMAKYTNAIASVQGGTEKTQFRISAGYQQEGTVTPGDLRDKKASVSLSINSTSDNNRFKLQFSGSYVADDNKLSSVNSIAQDAFRFSPNTPDLRHADGSLNYQLLPNGFPSFINPLAKLNTHYFNQTSNLIANATLSYQVIPGLELKSSFGYNKLLSNEIYGYGINHLTAAQKAFAQRTAEFNSASISSWIIEPQLTYKRNIGIGKLDGLLGSTFQQENRDRQKLRATGFTSDQAIFNIKAASTVQVDGAPNAVILSSYKYNALFGRLSYNIADKYLVNFTARRDGSSRFGRENRFNNFMAVGAAWIFSGEEFIKNRLPWLSFGKIRGSYGATGNDQIGDYGYLNLYGNLTDGVGNPYQGIVALQPSGDFPNPYLQWEETTKRSVTLDLGFFKDRILINATYYKNVCGNQLLYEGLPLITGGNGVRTNMPAKLQNTGLELGLNIRAVDKGNFAWQSNVNLTVPRNKFYGYRGPDASRSELDGRPLGVIKVYHYTGVDPVTGLYTVAGADSKPTSTPDPAKDMTVYIDLNPAFYGGLQNSISYKGLALDFLFQFVKQKAANPYFGSPNAGSPGFQAVNQSVSVLNRWQQVGDQVDLQKYSTSFDINKTYDLARQSDKYYSDASYIRLKNLSLSYALPSLWLSKLKLKSFRVYIQGQNLLTFTGYQGVDPENRTFDGLPPLKVLTAGLQIGL